MRAYVFGDAALAKHAGRFVWLSIDTEKPENAAFLEKHPIDVWPTLLVIEPNAEAAVLRWPGSANAAQLERLLDDGERALAPPEPDSDTSAAAVLARADRLAAERKTEGAIAAYRAALDAASPERRPRIVESLVLSLLAAHRYEPCTRTALDEAPRLPRGPSFANIAASALYCAIAAPHDAPFRKAALDGLAPLAREALALPGLLSDDRSGLHEVLVEAMLDTGDAAGARALSAEWLAFLESEAARAPSAEARASFDSHRVLAAMKAGTPDRAIAALQQSERDLPSDYNAPARLALVYKEMGQLDDALAAIDRALGRGYGPRRLRLLDSKAQLFEAKGDRSAAVRTLLEALLIEGSLPPAQRRPEVAARLRGRITQLEMKK